MNGVLEIGKQVFETEIESLEQVKNFLSESFIKAVDLILASSGRVIVTGMGKSGHIGAKIAATLASTGTSSFFVHPAEMGHGDLGMILPDDLVIAISYSGKTDELRKILLPVKKLGVRIIAITGDSESILANYADITLLTPITREACPLELAPTSSTTAALVLGDALAIALMKKKNFQKDDFARSHPLGSLGQSVVPISDLMRKDTEIPSVFLGSDYWTILEEINSKKLGLTTVLSSEGQLMGVITDGDLRRAQIKYTQEVFTKQAKDIMTINPFVMNADDLAVGAVKFMEKKRIGQIIIVNDDNSPIGVLDLKDLLSAGFMIS